MSSASPLHTPSWGWVVIQVAATIVPALHLPAMMTTAVVVLVLLGFAIALVLAWLFRPA